MELFRPSLSQARQYIDNIDFSNIIKKITRKDPNIAYVWTIEQVEKAIIQYRNFLFLLRKYVDYDYKLPPSIEIDEIWHHHILDTRKYFKDCNEIFGEYRHHFPYFGMRGPEDFKDLQESFEITQNLYKLEFGEYIEEIIET